jgi:hypothetical protein
LLHQISPKELDPTLPVSHSDHSIDNNTVGQMFLVFYLLKLRNLDLIVPGGHFPVDIASLVAVEHGLSL